MRGFSFSFNKLGLIFGLCLLLRAPLWASDYHSPRTASLGGAGHAGPLLNDSIWLNPSYASFLPTYSIGLNWLWFKGPTPEPPGSAEQVHGRSYAVSIQDGRNELLQAGVAYSLREDGGFVHLGVSKNFLKRVGVGVSGKYFFNSVTKASGSDLVFSSTGLITPWLQTALIVDNLLETAASQARGLYREFVIGSKFNLMGIMLIYFDPHYVPTLSGDQKFGHELGLEFVVMNDFFLRLGNFRNANIPFEATRGRGYGVGIGWIAPRISFDYGIQRALEPRQATAHTIGTTLYF